MAPRTRLAIVGASVRAAAQSALRAGYDVVGADLFADADLDGVCPITKIPCERYPDGLADWLARQGVDAWMYTGALENHPGLVDRMAEIAPLWGVCGQPLRGCRDPLQLQRTFKTWGIAFPETRLSNRGSRCAPGWLAKTYRHAGGAGVGRLQVDRDPSGGRSFVQEVVPGTPHSVVYAVNRRGAIVLGLTEQLIGDTTTDAPCWAYCGSIGPLPTNSAIRAAICRIGECLAAELGLVGLIGVDLMIDGDRVTVIEINPRYTASVEVLETTSGDSCTDSVSCVELHVRACLRSFGLQSVSETDTFSAKRVVFARRRVRFEGRLAHWVSRELRAGRLADAPRHGESVDAGRPLFTVFAVGDDPDSVRVKLAKTVAAAERMLDSCEPLFPHDPPRND